MRISVLASGSKGNVTYLETKNKRFLLDAGRNYKYINEELKKIGVDIKTIDYIIISHNHIDHISALKTLMNRTNATIIISEKQLYEINDLKNYSRILVCENELDLDGVNIKSFKSSHDAIDSRNFVISEGDKRIGYITDTGYINVKYFKYLFNLDIYLFESNHDVELLQHGPYPELLKRRILSDSGHLSNKAAAFYLTKLIGDKTKEIILIHLSEINNLEEVAMNTINSTFMEYGIEFHNVICARQNEATRLVEI